jgi:hypothetical protein
MHITFERTGGFMGRKVSLALELDELPSDQAETLRRHLDEANFFAIEETPAAPSPVRDKFHYLVTVETRDVKHTIHTTDAAMPASLRPLIEELSQLARMPRGG